MSRLAVVQDVIASGVVAVIRMKDPSKLKGVADALIAGGVTAMEVTMTVPGAVGLIEQLAKDLPKGLRLGAGTVLDPETARQVILRRRQLHRRADAEPGDHRDVPSLRRRGDAGLFHADRDPGPRGRRAPTWSRCSRRRRSGRSSSRTCAAPLPQIKMMPTGGVSLTNAGEWIAAGAVAVGVGTALLDPKAHRREPLRGHRRQRPHRRRRSGAARASSSATPERRAPFENAPCPSSSPSERSCCA